MAYAGTKVEWVDQSQIVVNNTIDNSYDRPPLFAAVSSFDRGPEDLREVEGEEFYRLYGSTMSFARHGQPAIQAANIINGGGRLLIKRLVADDATLGNFVAFANVINKIYCEVTENVTIGKTIEQLTGEESSTTEYAGDLDIISTVGDKNNTTKLTIVDPVDGAQYLYMQVTDETALVLDSELNSKWAALSGSADAEVTLTNGTKIGVAETIGGKVKRYGIIEVVSKVPHEPNASISGDTTVIKNLSFTSSEGEEVGYTTINITLPKVNKNDNVFGYYLVDSTSEVELYSNGFDFTEAEFDQIFTEAEATETSDGGYTFDVKTTEGKIIVIGEFAPITETSASLEEYVGGKSILKASYAICVVKPSKDDRTSRSTNAVVPNTTLYVVNSMENTVSWTASYITNIKSIEELERKLSYLKPSTSVSTDATDDNNVIIIKKDTFPIFWVADIGRGVTEKSIKFTPDHTVSKGLDYHLYDLTVYNGSTIIDQELVALQPGAAYNRELIDLNESISDQVKFGYIKDYYDQYVNKLCEVNDDLDPATLKKYDLMFMTTYNGTNVPYITLDPDSIDFNSTYGLALGAGSNGEFGDAPFGGEAWTKKAIEVFDGSYSDEVWDLDQHKIAAIFDANYPDALKTAICKYVVFREDCVFYRDLGVNVDTYYSILNKYKEINYGSADPVLNAKFNPNYYDEINKFISYFFTTYQIYDPEALTKIKVTCMYDLSRILIDHIANRPYAPIAGYANSMILPSAIKGTLNFTPRVTPSVDQKQVIDDLRLNYAIYEQDDLVVQSTWCSLDYYSQLSYVNNVMAVQEVIRAVRTSCPRERFKFITGTDFSEYAEAVNAVLDGFRSNFTELTFEYTQNKIDAAQKIFRASIYVRFGNWVNAERFTIYALPTEETE